MGLPLCTPPSLKNSSVQDELAGAEADVIIVVAYGLILPASILRLPKYGCINLHASLLPRWRGAAPIQRALLAGDEKTGISIMQMDEGLDTGPILAQASLRIEPSHTAGMIHDKLSALGADCLLKSLELIEKEPVVAKEQEGEATYAEKIDKSEARIDWSCSAVEIDRKVRALNPWPGAWFSYQGNRIKIICGEIKEGFVAPGQSSDDKLSIGCGEGIYRITRLQRIGKKPQESADFLRGFPVPQGSMMDDI